MKSKINTYAILFLCLRLNRRRHLHKISRKPVSFVAETIKCAKKLWNSLLWEFSIISWSIISLPFFAIFSHFPPSKVSLFIFREKSAFFHETDSSKNSPKTQKILRFSRATEYKKIRNFCQILCLRKMRSFRKTIYPFH